MDPQEYDEILRTLVRIVAHQDTINQDQRALNDRLTSAIERIDRSIVGIDQTLARLETILARLGQQGENGRQT